MFKDEATGPAGVEAPASDEPTDDAQLDLSHTSVAIEDGLVMVLGPDRDPVPPPAFSAALAAQPGAILPMPDGTRVAARRVALVLEAQARGPLADTPEGAHAWIRAMLGAGPQPDAVAPEKLSAEAAAMEAGAGEDTVGQAGPAVSHGGTESSGETDFGQAAAGAPGRTEQGSGETSAEPAMALAPCSGRGPEFGLLADTAGEGAAPLHEVTTLSSDKEAPSPDEHSPSDRDLPNGSAPSPEHLDPFLEATRDFLEPASDFDLPWRAEPPEGRQHHDGAPWATNVGMADSEDEGAPDATLALAVRLAHVEAPLDTDLGAWTDHATATSIELDSAVGQAEELQHGQVVDATEVAHAPGSRPQPVTERADAPVAAPADEDRRLEARREEAPAVQPPAAADVDPSGGEHTTAGNSRPEPADPGADILEVSDARPQAVWTLPRRTKRRRSERRATWILRRRTKRR